MLLMRRQVGLKFLITFAKDTRRNVAQDLAMSEALYNH